ncbi:MAG: O-acetylhomoserine aminocarboxypropyltransferase/cysteine synthase [Pseudomonadota bacterium]|nr:O-acetylhomoserine aminocarboxypropyltransferase/cysteine synthase [Pseudomonadota bacterium]
MRRETLSIHGGFGCDPATHAVAAPIYQNVAYEFDSADQAAAMFDLEIPGYRYSRISNPTIDILERRVALLEGGRACLATASGQAALSTALLNVADGGGSIVAPPQLYGTTHTLLAHTLRRHGVEARFAKSDQPKDIAALVDDTTRAVFCESVGNPAGNICDIEALAKIAHGAGAPLIVDNTVATPILLRPIEYGADIVVHSLTKFMGGHGVAMGGAIVDAGRFDWRAGRYPTFCEPDESYHGLVYADRFGAEAFIARARSVYQRTTGAVLAPMSAFLILQGIETLALRVERHVANARAVALALRDDPRVAWVEYVGFEDHRYHALASKYLNGQAPSLLTFGVRGGHEAAKRFYDALKLVKRVVNIGDTRSLCCHPASTTHRQMTAQEQARAGVSPETVRLSVGIEHVEDILADLDHALSVGAAPAMAAE